MPSLCRTCFAPFEGSARCPACGSPRVVHHPELWSLSIAHMDCDAFYASVEKRDNPELRDKPIVIGGGRRGVVSTACYLARTRGVRSAMPMFEALRRCPEAIVVKGRMEVYAEVSAQIRAMMLDLTPAVEPLSLDEAFLDLSGTARLHGAPPAVMLAKLTARMEQELGITGSMGLSHNKFLAKIASDLQKPRGFSVIGEAETSEFLRDKPVGIIWGIGPATQAALARQGIRTIADLRRWDRSALHNRFGSQGERLWHLARGEDHRPVSARRKVKSISHEQTFSTDISDSEVLTGHLWRLSEKVADRAKAKALSGLTVTLKLKEADHHILTRRQSLPQPTQLADVVFHRAKELFDRHPHTKPYRLLGVGLSDLRPEAEADREADLLDPDAAKRAAAERASDAIRARFGAEAIRKGRALR